MQIDLVHTLKSNNSPNLWPFLILFGTYSEFHNITTNADLRRQIDHYLSGSQYAKILTDNAAINPTALGEIVKYLAQNCGKPIRLTAITKVANVSVHTVAKYIKLLAQNNVIVEIKGYHVSKKDEVSRFPKYFFTNQIDLAYFSGINLGGRPTHAQIKTLWYNFCVVQKLISLQKQANSQKNELYYWQNYEGCTYDIVYHNKFSRKTAAYNCHFIGASANTTAIINTLVPIPPINMWSKIYPKIKVYQITENNFLDYLVA